MGNCRPGRGDFGGHYPSPQLDACRVNQFQLIDGNQRWLLGWSLSRRGEPSPEREDVAHPLIPLIRSPFVLDAGLTTVPDESPHESS